MMQAVRGRELDTLVTWSKKIRQLSLAASFVRVKVTQFSYNSTPSAFSESTGR